MGVIHVEYHAHTWAFRTRPSPQRGFWECTHVNGDSQPCHTRQADLAGIPYGGTGMHMYQTEEES